MSTPAKFPAPSGNRAPQGTGHASRDEFSHQEFNRREMRALSESINELTHSIEQMNSEKRQQAEMARQQAEKSSRERLIGEVIFVIKAVLTAFHL